MSRMRRLICAHTSARSSEKTLGKDADRGPGTIALLSRSIPAIDWRTGTVLGRFAGFDALRQLG